MTDPKTEEIIQSVVHAGWVCADVGASIGEMTRVMSERVGNAGKVYAFEPGSYGERFEARNVEWVPKAVSMDQYRSYWRQDPTNPNPNGGLMHCQTECPVDVTTLDLFFEGKVVDFIKIDTEGMDHQVIMGATRVIERCRPAIIYECMPGFVEQRHLPIYEIIELILSKYSYALNKVAMPNDVLATPL